MPIIYRTDGAWGAGKGANLAPAEVDGNFYDLEGRVGFIEDNPVEPVTPIAINIEGSAFTMGLSNGETLGPIAITMPMPTWRGDWNPSFNYNELDFFIAPDGGLGAVMVPHTSAASFDWGALDPDSGLPLYRQLIGGSGTTSGIADLIDVALSGQAANDMLVWDAPASLWRNKTPAVVATILPAFGGSTGGAAGTKGLVPAPAAGDDAAGKVLGAGGTWIVPAGGSGGSSSLAGLSDVSIVSPVNLSLLQYHASDGKWHNATLAGLGAGTVTSVDSGAGLTGGPITATGTLALAPVAALNLLANISGGSGAPAGVTLSQLLDAVLGSTRGSILRRGATDWAALGPGSAGQYLQSGGSGADVSWSSPVGSGTVTSVASGSGLTGGPITATGTLSLAQIADNQLLANTSGSTAAPTGTSLTLLLDEVLGSVRGQIIYRGATTWAALPPGNSGYYLQTNGAGANPAWAAVKGGGGSGGAPDPSIWKAAVAYATAAALPANTYANGTAGVGATLTATVNGALSVDGNAVTAGDRLLVKDETNLSHNGCYTVSAAGGAGAPYVLTRTSDFDQPTETAQGSAFPVGAGTVNDNTAWVLITGGTVTIGTTPLEFQALAATMPIATAGQVIGNPNTYDAPAIPTSLSAIIDRAISAMQGAVLYRSGSAWSALAPGTSGQVLTTGGAAANPTWAAAGGGSLPSGTANDQLVYISGAWTAQRPRYVISCFVPGTMTASQYLLIHRLSKAITIPGAFAAYLGHASQARGTANATGSTVIDVQKATSAAPGTFSSVGSISISAGSMVGSFATVGGTAVTFAQGDTIALVGPATPDATFANFAATLVGYET